MSDVIQATRRPRRRPPKTYDSGRICAVHECETIVSRYNKSDRCNLHRATRYPRIRGAQPRSSNA